MCCLAWIFAGFLGFLLVSKDFFFFCGDFFFNVFVEFFIFFFYGFKDFGIVTGLIFLVLWNYL